MEKQIKQVEEFMTLFGQEVKAKVEMPSSKIAALRVSLLEEEVKELAEAVEQGDLVAVLDAFTDIRYVLEGAILAFGMQGIAQEAFEAVHASNMQKACDTIESARLTQESYTKIGVPTYIEQSPIKSQITGENLWLIKREADKKVLKSIHWEEQDLKSIVDRVTV